MQGRVTRDAYVAGDAAGRIRRIDLETGTVQWTYDSPMENLTAPAVGGGLVCIGSRGGLFVALDQTSGDLKWRGRINDILPAAATWHQGSFYLSTKGGQGVCLDGSSGTGVWSFAASGPLGASPGAAGSLILFASDDHHVYAFEER